MRFPAARPDPLRVSAVLLVLALMGVVAGAALIGRAAVGVAIIADSVAVGWYALLREIPDRGSVVRERQVRTGVPAGWDE